MSADWHSRRSIREQRLWNLHSHSLVDLLCLVPGNFRAKQFFRHALHCWTASSNSQGVYYERRYIVCSRQFSRDTDAESQGELLTSEPLPDQAKACIANLEAIIKEAHPGATLKNIVRCGVFITDMRNFAEVNKGYEAAFGNHRPARTCVAVKELPKGVAVEIEAIAVF